MLERLAAYKRVVVLSGEVHWGSTAQISYWKRRHASGSTSRARCAPSSTPTATTIGAGAAGGVHGGRTRALRPGLRVKREGNDEWLLDRPDGAEDVPRPRRDRRAQRLRRGRAGADRAVRLQRAEERQGADRDAGAHAGLRVHADRPHARRAPDLDRQHAGAARAAGGRALPARGARPARRRAGHCCRAATGRRARRSARARRRLAARHGARRAAGRPARGVRARGRDAGLRQHQGRAVLREDRGARTPRTSTSGRCASPAARSISPTSGSCASSATGASSSPATTSTATRPAATRPSCWPPTASRCSASASSARNCASTPDARASLFTFAGRVFDTIEELIADVIDDPQLQAALEADLGLPPGALDAVKTTFPPAHDADRRVRRLGQADRERGARGGDRGRQGLLRFWTTIFDAAKTEDPSVVGRRGALPAARDATVDLVKFEYPTLYAWMRLLGVLRQDLRLTVEEAFAPEVPASIFSGDYYARLEGRLPPQLRALPARPGPAAANRRRGGPPPSIVRPPAGRRALPALGHRVRRDDVPRLEAAEDRGRARSTSTTAGSCRRARCRRSCAPLPTEPGARRRPSTSPAAPRRCGSPTAPATARCSRSCCCATRRTSSRGCSRSAAVSRSSRSSEAERPIRFKLGVTANAGLDAVVGGGKGFELLGDPNGSVDFVIEPVETSNRAPGHLPIPTPPARASRSASTRSRASCPRPASASAPRPARARS